MPFTGCSCVGWIEVVFEVMVGYCNADWIVLMAAMSVAVLIRRIFFL